LRSFRIAAGLTRQELARLTRVSIGRLASYESGFARSTSWNDQVRLFKALGVRLVVNGTPLKKRQKKGD
jgi:transcriptional regulator with XRE-family HTH domain